MHFQYNSAGIECKVCSPSQHSFVYVLVILGALFVFAGNRGGWCTKELDRLLVDTYYPELLWSGRRLTNEIDKLTTVACRGGVKASA
jgi:hypothetical protein